MDKLPKALIHKYSKASYLVKIDKHQKEKILIKGEDGEDIELFSPKAFDRNYRTKNVNECTVVKAYGDPDYKEGDVLRVNHWLFQDNEQRWIPPLLTVNGVDLYKVDAISRGSQNIYWGYRDGKRVLPEGVFITEYLEYESVSSLLLVNSFTGRRRDLMRIIEIPQKESDFKIGDLVIISESASK